MDANARASTLARTVRLFVEELEGRAILNATAIEPVAADAVEVGADVGGLIVVEEVSLAGAFVGGADGGTFTYAEGYEYGDGTGMGWAAGGYVTDTTDGSGGEVVPVIPVELEPPAEAAPAIEATSAPVADTTTTAKSEDAQALLPPQATATAPATQPAAPATDAATATAGSVPSSTARQEGTTDTQVVPADKPAVVAEPSGIATVPAATNADPADEWFAADEFHIQVS